MRTSDIDLKLRVFEDHPKSWQSPEDLADAFVLAWALEQAERTRIDPGDPYSVHVNQALPGRFRFDTLGLLIQQAPADTSSSGTSRGRLTCLALAWRLFDQLNQEWRLQVGDVDRYSVALAQATRGFHEPGGVFSGLSGDFARCLLSDRIHRASSGSLEITRAETWFVTGHQDLLALGAVASVPFTIAGTSISVPLTWDAFVWSVWSIARVLVRRNSAEFYLAKYADRTPMLLDILDDGAGKIAAHRRDAPWQMHGRTRSMTFDSWPR